MFSVRSANPNRLLFRGLISMLIAIAVVAIPDLSLIMVMRGLGVFLLLDGLIAMLITYYRRKKQPQSAFAIVPRGAASLILGAILLVFPTLLVNIFVFVIGLILLLAGLSQLSTQISGRSIMGFSWLLTLIAIVALISGIVMLTRPFESAQAILVFFGVIIGIYGIGEIIWSVKLRKYQKSQPPQPGEVVDTEYEELQ